MEDSLLLTKSYRRLTN